MVMFPQTGLFLSLQIVTNPYSMKVAGKNFLEVFNQPITDILRKSTLSGPLEAMAKCLEWSNVAPTPWGQTMKNPPHINLMTGRNLQLVQPASTSLSKGTMLAMIDSLLHAAETH
jgi:hypothetical protein